MNPLERRNAVPKTKQTQPLQHKAFLNITTPTITKPLNMIHLKKKLVTTCTATDHIQLWMRKQYYSKHAGISSKVLLQTGRGQTDITLLSLLPKDTTVTLWASAYHLAISTCWRKTFCREQHSCIIWAQEHQCSSPSHNLCPKQTATQDCKDRIFWHSHTPVWHHWRCSVKWPSELWKRRFRTGLTAPSNTRQRIRNLQDPEKLL